MTAIFTFFGHSNVLLINLVVRNGAFWDNQKKNFVYIYIYTKISKILELFHVSKTNPLIYKIKNSSFL